jgi:23S rRNA pseudouridine1911/1915/1917 synthase
MKIKVEIDNVRLDKFLADNTEYSRSLILKMLKDGYILVNGNVEKPSYKVNIDDEIEIKDGFIKDTKVEAKKMDLDIVYEDDDIMVINKPSGVVVHPGNGNYDNTLVNGLMYYADNLSDGYEEYRPGIVHRIDKDTSGLIIIAKNNKSQEILGKYFKEHSIKREYIALIHGILDSDSVLIDAPIGRDESSRKMMKVTSKNSKSAITHVKVLKRYKNFTLVKCRLETGRTHQIRVHMKYINHPIFNDPIYSKDKATEFGQYLHSYSMEFNHPITNKKMYFECPLPKEFQDTLDSLEEL